MSKIQFLRNKIAAGVAGVTALVVTGSAFAADPLADAATASMDKSTLYLIGAAVLTLTGVVVIIRKSQRAGGG
ncbi:hypothetical protein [Xanthomonas sp. CFBP 8445]|uniref:hypothetical protein n=1 Tax=Xanthomonas sp. CFBP 8445 TaxID=2971236 RepID=UPI0002DF9A3C|nr:hypothetical protein [Xanthomonas sp. CFBP 8445]UYC14014.1 hypothetical protein NUG21_09925 [Xanthomonas sp. CFBP 8445]